MRCGDTHDCICGLSRLRMDTADIVRRYGRLCTRGNTDHSLLPRGGLATDWWRVILRVLVIQIHFDGLAAQLSCDIVEVLVKNCLHFWPWWSKLLCHSHLSWLPLFLGKNRIIDGFHRVLLHMVVWHWVSQLVRWSRWCNSLRDHCLDWFVSHCLWSFFCFSFDNLTSGLAHNALHEITNFVPFSLDLLTCMVKFDRSHKTQIIVN